MKILEVNYADLPGHIFNGYDLHISLNELGYDCKQMVNKKYSNCSTVKVFAQDEMLKFQLVEWEKKHSISNVIIPFGYELEQSKEFQEADVVHYHILHNYTVSFLDYARLMMQKCSVWTIHDPWILTGNCIHPLECTRWRTGCGKCSALDDQVYVMQEDNTAFMWELKKDILGQMNPNIVISTDFMRKYITQSPLTQHFDKLHKIPFGVNLEKYNINLKEEKKRQFKIPINNKVIGFRVEDSFIKGCKYLYEALKVLKMKENVTLICVGYGEVPKEIKEMYNIIELGWVNDENRMIDFLEATDIFIMPSLAESFGLMAIEAMAAGCAVVCFETTTVAEITNAPECGVAVEYRSSEGLAKAVQTLLENRVETKKRGELGREIVRRNYQFKDYVENHRRLYEKIYIDYYRESSR